ncbi:hypothetical protein EPO34_04735 [Patescibacteria group bacterium]|nr:MAG: hypothetical protein EPO34_04735 [Patescibacteria group bacterium]
MLRKQIVLVVDLGGVVIDKYATDLRGMRYSRGDPELPEVTHAFEALRELADMGITIYMLSSGGSEATGRRTRWLRARNFEGRTGIPWSNVKFCGSRHDKRWWCKVLRATHIVDDRREVLLAMPRKRELYLYLFRPALDAQMKYLAEGKPVPELGPEVRTADAWTDLELMIRADIEEACGLSTLTDMARWSEEEGE